MHHRQPSNIWPPEPLSSTGSGAFSLCGPPPEEPASEIARRPGACDQIGDLIGRISDLYARRAQGRDFLLRRSTRAGDDRSGMPHTPPRRSSSTGYECDHWLANVELHVCRGLLFSFAADLTDQGNRMGLRIGL